MIDSKDLPKIKHLDSMGWSHIKLILRTFAEDNPVVKDKLRQAKVAYDLGSSVGQSAIALALTCPKLEKLYCVDNEKGLKEPFRGKLAPIVEESRQDMVDFLASSPQQADVVMLASARMQPLFGDENIKLLAGSIKSGGILFELNPDFPMNDNQPIIHDYFKLLPTGYRGHYIWIRD